LSLHSFLSLTDLFFFVHDDSYFYESPCTFGSSSLIFKGLVYRSLATTILVYQLFSSLSRTFSPFFKKSEVFPQRLK